MNHIFFRDVPIIVIYHRASGEMKMKEWRGFSDDDDNNNNNSNDACKTVFLLCLSCLGKWIKKIQSLTLFSRAQSFALTSGKLAEDAYTTAEVSGSLKIESARRNSGCNGVASQLWEGTTAKGVKGKRGDSSRFGTSMH